MPRSSAEKEKGNDKSANEDVAEAAGRSRCAYCWAKVSSFPSSVSHHQRWDLGCLQWQKYHQGYSWEDAGEAAVRTKQRRERKALREQASEKESGSKEEFVKKSKRKTAKKERKRRSPTPSPSPGRPCKHKPLSPSSDNEEALLRVKSGKAPRTLVIKLAR